MNRLCSVVMLMTLFGCVDQAQQRYGVERAVQLNQALCLPCHGNGRASDLVFRDVGLLGRRNCDGSDEFIEKYISSASKEFHPQPRHVVERIFMGYSGCVFSAAQ
jgi:hypothetical protein